MRVRCVACRALLASVLMVTASQPAWAITFGQKDDFQTGAEAFWSGGSGPIVQSDGGPAGVGDRFLQHFADGSGAGGRLNMYNREQWIGNYTTAGVTAVEMDLKNFSTQSLRMRIAFKSSTSIGAPGYCHSTGFVLPADGAWHRVVFNLTASDFSAVGSGAGTFADVLAGNHAEFRLLHGTSPTLTGPFITGSFGVDNIRAIPAPGATAVLGLGAAGLLRRRRR